MKLWIPFILIPVVLMMGCGQSSTRVRQPSIEGVTLADLRPEVTEKTTPVMLFMVTTYLVDEAYAEEVQRCYESLQQGSIRFLDKVAFEANGFFALLGTGMQAGSVLDCLTSSGAERLHRANLILDAGTEVPFSEGFINQEQTIVYVPAGGGSIAVALENGTLGWWLTARPDPDSSRQVHARIQPVFIPRGVSNWPGAQEYVRKMGYRFDDIRFDISLREADFVILGDKHDPAKELTVFEKLLFLQPGKKTKMRLYVISCVKAEG